MKPIPSVSLSQDSAQATAAAADALSGVSSSMRDEDKMSSITIDVDPHAPGKARRHVARVLEAREVGDEEVVGDVVLLVSEVVTNVLRHENSTLVDVEVAVDVVHAVTVTVRGWEGAGAALLLQPDRIADSATSHERGLAILDVLASAWGTRRSAGRTAVWFTVLSRETGAGDIAGNNAQAVVATARAITAATGAELTVAPERAAERAAVTAEQAAVRAAVKTADAAKIARSSRAAEAAVAAKTVAALAANTVDAVQRQAEAVARQVATAAADAAAIVSTSITPGGDAVAARAALQVEGAVIAAAASRSEETARAAVVVARAVAAAAAAVAATTAAAATAVEHEVSDVAAAVQAVAAAAAQQLANDTLERGAALAIVAREAAEASERLERTNQRLLQAGREDHAIALALQAAMLTDLPRTDELQLAARYLTAATQAQVGGDWYDAVVLPGRATTLVIGDVIGHDIVAAAMMGQLRNLLRALAWERDGEPSAIVTRLDQAMRDLQVNTMASLVMLTVEASTTRADAAAVLRWTNAGHPAPILIHNDGTTHLLDDSTDVLLGVTPDAVRTDHQHLAPPGATLVLYTDGLIETRNASLHAGQQRLLANLANNHHLELGDLLDAVITQMVGDQPRDDVAVLAARLPKQRSR